MWAHLFGPGEARTVVTEYFVDHDRRIQVGYKDLCVVPCDVCVHVFKGWVMVLLAQHESSRLSLW